MPLRFLKTRVSAFRRNESGVSAVEFALILPAFALLFFGAIEVSFLMTVDRKVTSTASTLGDLVARGTTMTESEVSDIFAASSALFAPYDGSTAKMRVTSIVQKGGKIEVAWSRAKNMTPYAAGTTLTVPNGLLSDGQSVVYSEVEYDYKSTLGFFLPSAQKLSEEFYLRPRRVDAVEVK
jgi:Flp pilus assembly protein TadG